MMSVNVMSSSFEDGLALLGEGGHALLEVVGSETGCLSPTFELELGGQVVLVGALHGAIRERQSARRSRRELRGESVRGGVQLGIRNHVISQAQSQGLSGGDP